MECAGTKPHVQSATGARRVIGLLVPGTDTFAIDVSLGQRKKGRKGSVRGGRHGADVIGVETRAVMLGGPKTPCRLVGERDGGLVVADPCGEGQRPRLRAIEGPGFSVRDLRAAQHRSGAVDQQRAQVDIAALGDAAEPSPGTAGVFARCEAQATGEVASGGKSFELADRGTEGRCGEQAHATGALQALAAQVAP